MITENFYDDDSHVIQTTVIDSASSSSCGQWCGCG